MVMIRWFGRQISKLKLLFQVWWSKGESKEIFRRRPSLVIRTRKVRGLFHYDVNRRHQKFHQKGSYTYTYNMAIELHRLLSKKQERSGWWEWIPLTLLWLFCEFRKVEHTFAMLGPQRRWWKLWSSVSPFYDRTPFYSTKIEFNSL